jgi:DNA polymerase alpha subunit A
VQDIAANLVSLDKFIITKGLTKNPKDYTDSKSQPHVHVALDMLAQGETVRVGDHIPYVVCQGDGPMAARAYHPQKVLKAAGLLTLDTNWYLSNQVSVGFVLVLLCARFGLVLIPC